jgi:hypothetical protein
LIASVGFEKAVTLGPKDVLQHGDTVLMFKSLFVVTGKILESSVADTPNIFFYHFIIKTFYIPNFFFVPYFMKSHKKP